MEIIGNGNNEFYIIVKCPHEVYRTEWAELLFLLNDAFEKHDGGKYSNVGAYLERVEELREDDK